MLWVVCFGLALIFFTLGVIGFAIRRKKGKNEVRYLGGGVFLACISICFPVMCLSDQAGFAILMSISQSIRMFLVDTGMSDVLEGLQAESLGMLFYPYKVAVCLLYLLAPVFTLTIVLHYFSNFFEQIRLSLKKRQNLYVFSELNEHSLGIATNIYNSDKKKGNLCVVFCCSDEKDNFNIDLEEKAKELNAIYVPREINYLRLKNMGRYITYFFISEDMNKNLDHTLQMLREMTGESLWLQSGGVEQKNTALYCYAAGMEAEILLDAQEKENLKVVLMDEVRDAMYEHLYLHPLYANMDPTKGMKGKREKISVLILGGGKIGIEFLKASVWSGQMKNFGLEVHIVDVKSALVRKRFEVEFPELLSERSGYHIDFIQADVFSEEIKNNLDFLENINYCVISLGDDELNIRAAIWLKRYFYLREFKIEPLISLYIENPGKSKAVWNLCEKMRTKQRLYYNIIPFGNRSGLFNKQSAATFIIEYLGLGVHSHYCRITKESSAEERRNAVRNFYEKQSNRQSSIANGLHIVTKLWELGYGVLRLPKEKWERDIFDRCIHPVDFYSECRDELGAYYALEHERWMAYMRTEGWQLATRGGDCLEDIRSCYEDYCMQFKNQNYLMKLHPALVPIRRRKAGEATLQEVEDMIAEVNMQKNFENYFPGYIQSDIEVVDHIGEIVSGSWCGHEGISIYGELAKEGECVVCRLGDMMRYYRYIYDGWKENATPEEMITLRGEIRRCCFGVIRTNQGREREEAYACLAEI